MNICDSCGVTKGNTSNDSLPTEPSESETNPIKPTEPEQENSKPTEPSTPENSAPGTDETISTSGSDTTGSETDPDKTSEFPWTICVIAAIVLIAGTIAIIVIRKNKIA